MMSVRTPLWSPRQRVDKAGDRGMPRHVTRSRSQRGEKKAHQRADGRAGRSPVIGVTRAPSLSAPRFQGTSHLLRGLNRSLPVDGEG